MATGALCSKEFALCMACVLLAVPLLVAQDPSNLSLEHYSKTCPNVEHVVRTEMECAGCDGSVLLDDTATMIGEKQAEQNANSLKGFDLVDKIKRKLEAECPGMVSCADLLAIAARDAVVLVGGPYWDVPVGRLDSKKTSLDLANRDIPTAQQGLITLISKFWEKGLDATDMVALVGMFSFQCCTFTTKSQHLHNRDTP
ncbi:hypothetical protein ABZP36_011345 [Zizania latifolia]